ncbi:uncharacterized protein [Notamacropus eugenii]|uniref:uncharacterized protein n=1 Tax=Notamacropus eugenii TaxID=9315 RepID=UPI003B680058
MRPTHPQSGGLGSPRGFPVSARPPAIQESPPLPPPVLTHGQGLADPRGAGARRGGALIVTTPFVCTAGSLRSREGKGFARGDRAREASGEGFKPGRSFQLWNPEKPGNSVRAPPLLEGTNSTGTPHPLPPPKPFCSLEGARRRKVLTELQTIRLLRPVGDGGKRNPCCCLFLTYLLYSRRSGKEPLRKRSKRWVRSLKRSERQRSKDGKTPPGEIRAWVSRSRLTWERGETDELQLPRFPGDLLFLIGCVPEGDLEWNSVLWIVSKRHILPRVKYRAGEDLRDHLL